MELSTSDSPRTRVLRPALEYLGRCKGAALLAILAMASGTGLQLIPPLLVQGLIDDGFPTGRALRSVQPLFPYILGLVLVPVAAYLVTASVRNTPSCEWGWVSWPICAIGSSDICNGSRSASIRRLRAANWPHALRTMSPSFATPSRGPSRPSSARCSMSSALSQSCAGFPGRSRLAACATLPFLLLPVHRVGERQRKLSEEAQEHQARLTALLQDVLNIGGYVLMRMFDRGDYEARRFASRNADVQRSRLRLIMSASWLNAFANLLMVLGPAAIYLWGGMQVIAGKISIGEVVAFVAYMTGLYAPIMQLASLALHLQETAGVFGRVVALLERTPEVCDAPDAAPLDAARGEIEFDKVAFAYGPHSEPALDGVSFRARPGQLVALVGHSGAGKTTAANLLMRFYDPQTGAVRVDGHDIRGVTQASLFSHVAMVTQDSYLFHDTIRAPISCTPVRTPPRPNSKRPVEPRTFTTSSRGCRTATTRSSASAVRCCRAANGSAWRSLGQSSRIREF